MKSLLFLSLIMVPLMANTISLPSPVMEGGVPLYNALKDRATNRRFDKDRPLTHQQISQILWAAAGCNRSNSRKRTAPSAWGNNEIELYVFLADGTYKYEPVEHELLLISPEDNREHSGEQRLVEAAPLTIVMIADLSQITQIDDEAAKLNTANVDAGYISQNIYLAAGSEGLITGARAWIDFEQLSSVLRLNENQRIIVANSVGYER